MSIGCHIGDFPWDGVVPPVGWPYPQGPWTPAPAPGVYPNVPATQGWICPRCAAVHAPWVVGCGCAPPSVAVTTLTLGGVTP